MRIVLSVISTIFTIYAYMVVGAMVSLALAYPFAPIWYFIHSLPVDLIKYGLEIAWSLGFTIVATWIIEDYWPRSAARSDNPTRPSRLRLRDLVPWLRTVPIDEDEAEAPALSPPRKSLPAPERD